MSDNDSSPDKDNDLDNSGDGSDDDDFNVLSEVGSFSWVGNELEGALLSLNGVQVNKDKYVSIQ